MSEPVLHLIGDAEWKAAQAAGEVTSESLPIEGFVHCCTQQQLLGVVERYYADRTDLLVLSIDPELLGDVELKWEAPAHLDGSPNTEAEEAQRYPHVYGPIPVTAVVDQHPIA